MSEKRGLNNGVQHPEQDSTNVSSSEDVDVSKNVKKQKTDIDNDPNKLDESSNVNTEEVAPKKSDDGGLENSGDCSKDEKVAPLVEKSSEEPVATDSGTSQEVKVKHEILSANALVIFGLHPLAKKEEMQEVLEKFGKVERLEMKKAFASTYCFCDYKTNEEARTAIEKLNGTDLRGKSLIVKLVNDKSDRAKPFAG